MRMSRLFSQTLRDAPADADIASHQLLIKAGYVRQLGAGIFSYLPLAFRTMRKIEDILRDEIDAIGGQEISMAVVHPAEIWKDSNRWYKVGPELTRFEDRAGRDMVLAMTHEEVVTDLVRKEINSYRQLPILVYQIQTKWRDEPRARAGLIRVREFTMKDSYSLDTSTEGLDAQYQAHYQAYFNIFARCGLPVIAVSSDNGIMGGTQAHEFMYLTPIGEDTLLVCDECHYAANREVAQFQKPQPEAADPLPIEKVETPDATTIDALAEFLQISQTQTAKAVFLVATVDENSEDVERFVFAVLRGDMELNETKVSNIMKAKALRPATDEEIHAIGAEPGYGSPIGVHDCTIIADEIIPQSANLVAGANERGYHFINVNYGRDFEANIVADITAAREGDPCPSCGHALHAVRGVEVGNIFKLGTNFSESMGATFLDENGKSQPVIMGSYGIGVDRLLACVAEAHHDDYGLKLPITIAPYQVHLVLLPDESVNETAEHLYADLQSAGIELLYDDRQRERAGVKFNDADLIGIPIRLTLSKRSLEQGGVEFKRRDQSDNRIIPLENIQHVVEEEVEQMIQAIQSDITEVSLGL